MVVKKGGRAEFQFFIEDRPCLHVCNSKSNAMYFLLSSLVIIQGYLTFEIAQLSGKA